MAFIQNIIDYIFKNYDLSKEIVEVVFPNKRASIHFKRQIVSQLSKTSWMPITSSVQQAMEKWSGLHLVDSLDVALELMSINDKDANNKVLKQNFFGLASQMAKDFDEIDQYKVDAKNLFESLNEVKIIENYTFSEYTLSNEDSYKAQSKYLQFFSSLINYYSALRLNLFSRKVGYYGMITRCLSELPTDELVKRIDGKKIVFAGFNALTTTEEDVVVRLVENGNAVMLWDLDEYYINDKKQEAGRFANDFFAKHRNLAGKKDYDNEHQGISFIGNALSTAEKEINVISVSGSSVQANALQLMMEKRENSVVVLADEALLIPTLNSLPDSVGEINVTMGYPFANTPLYGFIDQIFRFQHSLSDSKIDLWPLASFCDADFIKLVFNGKDYDSLMSWLKDKQSSSDLSLHVKDFSSIGISDDNQEDGASEDLARFLTLSSTKWIDSKDCIENLKSILRVSLQKIKDESYFVKNQISVAGKVLNKVESLIKKYDSVEILDLQMLILQIGREMSIAMKGEADGLQVMGLLETRNLDFDVVNMLSVNEGVIPKNKNSNSLIPYDVRKYYNLPTYNQQQAVYAYHFYRLLHNAKKINLFYNSLSDSSGLGEPSRFIRQIEYELVKKNPKVKLQHFQYKSPIINLKSNIISVDKDDTMLKKITKLSPTSISTYLRCSLQYYWKYIMNINCDEVNEEIQMNVIGSIIHNTLDELYRNFGNEIVTESKFLEVRNQYLDKCYQNALRNNNFRNGLPKTGFNSIIASVIDTMISRFLDNEHNIVKENSLRILCTEKELSFHLNNVELHGFADRIDLLNDKLRVIDYKTGSVNPYDVSISANAKQLQDMHDKSIQLIMYKYLFIKMLNSNTLGLDEALIAHIEEENIVPGIIALQKMSNGVFELKVNNADLANDFEAQCDIMFEQLISDIFDKNNPFTQTDDIKVCGYCSFRNICKRG
ncbi:MAG: PD-(D/E)XK nuclease family protein [Bacteroidales bacterium]|nr:PD-(D/E)XK nuclease family protein [Bacteroidales bacterium]